MWTKDEVAVYEQLVASHLSPTKIAQKMGKSRSAVSSRMSRDKDRIRKADPNYIKPEVAKVGRPKKLVSDNDKIAKEKKPKTNKPYRPPVLLTRIREYPIDRIGSNGCRWPMGDCHPSHPEFSFCGQHILDAGPYCREHAQRAFTSSHKG